MKYLKTSVTGEAADLLRSIPIIPSNLQVAWKSLEEMYGGEIRIKHSLLLKLRQLPDLSNNKNPADLQSYTIQAAMIFEQLLNMHSDIDNLSTCELIQSKLPKRIIHKLYGQGESQCPKSTKELLQKIKEISKAERLVAEIHNKTSNGHRNVTTMSAINNQYHRRNQDHRQQTNGQNQPPRQPVKIPCALNQSSRQGIITGQQNQHANRQPTHTQHSSSRPTANMLTGNLLDTEIVTTTDTKETETTTDMEVHLGTRTPTDINAIKDDNFNETKIRATTRTDSRTNTLHLCRRNTRRHSSRDSYQQHRARPSGQQTTSLHGNEHIGTIFLDTGSNTSYISSSFAERLQLLPIGSKKLRINTFGSIDTRSMISNIFNVLIKTKTSTKSINLCEVPHIASNIIAVDADKITCDKLLQGEEIQLNRQHKDIDVLIGLDHYLLLLGQVKTLRLSSGLQLHITDCGHILSGKEHPQQNVITFSNIVNNQNTKDDLCEQLQKFWSLESIGIKDIDPQCKAEEETNQFFHQTTTRQADGRYVVRLPYADQRNIPSNRALAYGRLQSALRQLEKNPEMLKKYAAIFTEQLSLEFIEEVPDESISDGPVVSYLPHHPVIKETSKSTKVRIVFDGSAKTNKVSHSLNDHLHTGERLLPDIAAIMLRIRQHNILISGDIEKAFLQLVLHQTDRDATRFLWKDPTDGHLICYRYRRVPFGLKPSPYLLNKTVRTHLESYDHPWAQAMINSFYVDNVFMGLDTAEEAMDFYVFAKKVFAEAQMNLCQFCSNSSTVNTFFVKHEKDTTIDRNQKILGISWDTETDEMIFMLPVPKTELLTKRKILKIIASCYDPLGFLTPVTLYGKLFFQQLATKDQSWDLPLSLNQHDSWKNVCTKWTGSEWRLKRKLFPDNFNIKTDQLELHIFTDASQLAYGSVAYLRITQSNGKTDSNYLLSKSRVAPVKSKYSIPQLETLGILTGVRLGNYCFQHIGLKIHQAYVWSDSLCSIDSLHTKSTSGSRFVKNRVREINELGERFIFSHVAGKINPADFLTRGLPFEELKQSELWLEGPTFLQSSDPLPLRLNSNSIATTTVTSALSISHPPAINVTRFSSFHRLLHMVMILIHFITRGKCSTQEKIARSKRLIFRLAQRIDPPSPETIQALQLHKDQDNDLWMFDGRVPSRPLIFLPKGDICYLLIMETHQRYFHSSPSFTLSKIRQHFWIPKGISYIKRVCQQCLGCRRINITPFTQPPFPPIPDKRTTHSNPFQCTGTDYAGPLLVKINNSPQKVWIIIFTCLYSRYTRAEVVTDMSTSSYLNALRRLSALFGTPKQLLSDNASQFKLLEDVFKLIKNKISSNVNIIDSTTFPTIHYITPHAPWEGSVYERMISLIKRALLRAGSSTTLFALDDFRTLLAECVSTINMRPLTYQTTDENIEPLTPTDFVFPQRRPSNDLLILNTPQDFDDLPLSKRSLAEDWQRLSSMTETFQRKWHQDYISVLQARRDFSHPQGKTSSYQPEIGDIVLINQPSSKSTTWPLARILEVKERSAIVKNGKTKRIVEYPLKLLFPLERPHTPDVQQSTDDSSSTPTADANDSVPNPTSTESTTTDNQGPQLRRSTRLRMPTQFFSAITILALITGSSGFEICQCTKTPIPTTTDSSPTTFGYLHQWITIVLFLLMFFGIYGWINFILILQCLFTWIEKCIQCVFSIVRLGSKQCRQHHQISPTIIVLLCLIQGSYSCNEIASIQDDVCTASADGKTCHLNKVVSINIRPNSQVGCFTISNNVKEVKNIEVRANSIISECNERSHHFTRQMKINHFFSHRCAGMRSCKGSTCENLNAEDGVPEFPAIAMDGPGFSRCYRSCGCVTCDCGSCSPSCLFSRISAEPTSFSIYEIFQCPTWNTRLEISVTINNNTTVYEVDHGIPLKLEDNMSLIVTGFSIPPSPIHGALFLRRMNLDGPSDISYSLSQPAQAGRPRRGTLSEVQCATAKDATDFNCLFDENVCTCITQGIALKCECEVLDLEEIILPRIILTGYFVRFIKF
ncbi:Protein CBG25357 [Caenorhabditis briggsae]|uniref:Protein CBG25357 n=1 Tax=Caenorhabditis briggsae TaxID=6238 RepID=B6IIM1_CAEBR|nr:Protein CBG25357 [Caenorhabditis briggsae]CAR99751.1 Protein CBG25357 [Caenorhabditis briggsae]